MTTYTIPELAPMIANAHGFGPDRRATYERRLRHLVANEIVPISTRDGSGPKARARISAWGAALASLLIYFGEHLNFDLRLQRKIAEAAREFRVGRTTPRHSRGALADAMEGVGADEPWAMVISIRADDSLRVHFSPYHQSRVNADVEALLSAHGRELLTRVVVGVSSLIRPFVRNPRTGDVR